MSRFQSCFHFHGHLKVKHEHNLHHLDEHPVTKYYGMISRPMFAAVFINDWELLKKEWARTE